jgi:hypothetical protein
MLIVASPIANAASALSNAVLDVARAVHVLVTPSREDGGCH